MGRAHEHLLHDVLFLPGHAGNAAAAALLGLIGGLELALDIAGLGEGVDALFLSDEVFDVHFTSNGLYLVRRSSPKRFFMSSSSFLTISSTRASLARMSSQSSIFACKPDSSSSI